jgi:hypothetical protein
MKRAIFHKMLRKKWVKLAYTVTDVIFEVPEYSARIYRSMLSYVYGAN